MVYIDKLWSVNEGFLGQFEMFDFTFTNPDSYAYHGAGCPSLRGSLIVLPPES
jgi:hypothetical protein